MDYAFTFGVLILALAGVGILWSRPEYGLFLYGLALGFPDFTISPGGVIGLRVDDGLLVFFLARLVLRKSDPYTPGQKRILFCQVLFATVCLISGMVRGGPWDDFVKYGMLRVPGCALALIVLPKVIDGRGRFRFLLCGAMAGGLSLLGQMVYRFLTTPAEQIATFQDFKTMVSPSSWNPNTVGQASMLLTLCAGLGFVLLARSPRSRRIWLGLATLFALTPMAVFTRSAGLGITAGYVAFAALTNRLKAVAGIAVLAVAGMVCYRQALPARVAEGATHVDIESGEGFSGRYTRWSTSVKTIEKQPLLGYGFGREYSALMDNYALGLSHNAFLSAWVELGVAGPLLIVVVLRRYSKAALSLYMNASTRESGALILSFLIALTLESMALSSLYWDKLPSLGLALALSAVGTLEREETRQEAPSAVFDSCRPLVARA